MLQLVIVDYKLHKEGMLVHYQLIRADGSSKRYSSMIKMLQGIDREDLEVLWRIVKAKHNDKRPEDEFERVLWGDLKLMFKGSIVCLRDFLMGGGGGGVGMLLFIVEVEEDGGYVGDDVETGVVGIIVDAQLGITGSVSLTVMFGDGD
ncbi:hypothetical protein Tco_1052238 [Tanacetum coccineum]